MRSSIQILRHLTCVSLFFSFFISLSLSNPRSTQAGLVCGNTPSGTDFVPNFVEIMNRLKTSLDNQLYGYASITTSSPNVFGFSQCHSDLSQTDCQLCFAQARDDIPKCLPYNSGRVYLDGCFVRFDNHSFMGEVSDPVNDRSTCGNHSEALSDKFMKLEFTKKVNSVVDNVTNTAPSNEGFAVAEEKGVVGVYALAQCWKGVGEDGCTNCLRNAGEKLKGCIPSGEGRAMYAGCYLRYSMDKFYGASAETVKQAKSGIKVVIVVVGVAAALILLSLLGAFVAYIRLQKSKQEHVRIGRLPSIVNKSSLNFKYETLEKATNYFDSSNKLGQGGAGSVYKGTLSDGKIVAVKRLFFSTRQWVDEFFNEVNLINGIRHKNLVGLLGCSIEGPESLLVYEYVPNMNLDRFLFDKDKAQILTWQQRLDIIYGIAEGLAYLHGGSGSRVKIIHRDIKGSNILLDENLIPKIADFGLARCVAGDKSHISTGIAGTLGYMAPEYLIRGQLTEKADVYAFGVLALEIVCGRKNSAFTLGSASVLRTVWKHFKSKTLPVTVDQSLRGDFSSKQASNVLQIGLLCTQASAMLRPSMASVLQMLNDDESEIPSPKQPPFLNASVLGSDETTESSLSGIISDKEEMSSSYTMSLSMTSP